MKQLALFDKPKRPKTYEFKMLGERSKLTPLSAAKRICEEVRDWNTPSMFGVVHQYRTQCQIGKVKVNITNTMFSIGKDMHMILTAEDMAATIETYLK